LGFDLVFGLNLLLFLRLFFIVSIGIVGDLYDPPLSRPHEGDIRRPLGFAHQLANLTLVTGRLGKGRALVNLGFV